MSKIKRNFTRPIEILTDVNPYALGSCIIKYGKTQVYITAHIEEDVPPFLKGKNKGWMTAEYSMLPGSTHSRKERERKGVSGRTQEIQRLIGRALRGSVDLSLLGARTLTLDCDVLVADGGTRTASITGGYVATAIAIRKLINAGKITQNPLGEKIIGISVGLNKEGFFLADLNYDEDSQCDVDMNFVLSESGKIVEIQGTAEGQAFSSQDLQFFLQCAMESSKAIFLAQEKALTSVMK